MIFLELKVPIHVDECTSPSLPCKFWYRFTSRCLLSCPFRRCRKKGCRLHFICKTYKMSLSLWQNRYRSFLTFAPWLYITMPRSKSSYIIYNITSSIENWKFVFVCHIVLLCLYISLFVLLVFIGFVCKFACFFLCLKYFLVLLLLLLLFIY